MTIIEVEGLGSVSIYGSELQLFSCGKENQKDLVLLGNRLFFGKKGFLTCFIDPYNIY